MAGGVGRAQNNREIVDAGGRTVRVPEEIRTLICLGPTTLRTIVYLGAADKVVGVEDMEQRSRSARPYWIAHPEFAHLPIVGPGGPGGVGRDPDLEAVLNLRPDVVLISYMERGKVDDLQTKLGIPVALLSSGSRLNAFETTLRDSLTVAGDVLNRKDRAEAIISFLERSKDDIKRRVSGIPPAERPTAYVGCVNFRGIHGIEGTEAVYPPFEWAGAKNVIKDPGKPAHLIMDRERLLDLNPDVIFLDAGGLPRLLEDAASRPDFYRELKAFRESRVYALFPLNAFAVNAGNAVLNAYAVGKALFPSRFNDVDLAKKADEVYEFLVGKPVYPEMTEMWGDVGRTLILPK
jgi:iron complex transport system substrate-binding protein